MNFFFKKVKTKMWAKVNLKADSELWASSLLYNTYVSLEKTTEKFWVFFKNIL